MLGRFLVLRIRKTELSSEWLYTMSTVDGVPHHTVFVIRVQHMVGWISGNDGSTVRTRIGG